MDVASLVIGIISLVIGFIPCVQLLVILPAVVGLVLGIASMGQKRSKGEPLGIALAGTILNALPLLVMFLLLVFMLVGVDVYSIGPMTIN